MKQTSYLKYAPSGVEWLGDVPGHWEVRRMKRIASLNPSKAEARRFLNADTPVTFLPMERVRTDGRIDEEIVPASTVWNGFSYFRRDDVLVAKITPCFENGKGACLDALPTEAGFGSTEFHVLRAGHSISPQFLYLLTTLPDFRQSGADEMTGAAGQQRVPQAFVENYSLPLPPLAEQDAIVRYLDHTDGRIRRCISAKERLVGLLEEQRQAVIHHAVTRGLDHNVCFKPSGVEWLGDMPAHWGTRRLRTVARIVNGATPSTRMSAYWDGDVIWLTPEDLGQLSTRYVERGARQITLEGYDSCGTNLAPAGSLAISTRAPIGHLGVLRSAACVNQGCRLLLPNEAIKSDYLYYALKTSRGDLEALGQGSTFMELSHGKLGGFAIPLPPLPEQTAIVEYLDKVTTDINAAIARARRYVELLREYRTRLIADVVTGKLDVRGAATTLSEKADESNGLGETDECSEPEMVNDHAD